MLIFFFFKQKTAYEMRISDWSSDVCASDLPHQPSGCCQHVDPHGKRRPGSWLRSAPGWTTACCSLTSTTAASVAVSKRPYPPPRRTRSEERRVGKEGVSTFRSR